MKQRIKMIAGMVMIQTLTACAGDRGPLLAPNAARERAIGLDLLTRYDFDGDRLLSRAELEGALQEDFASLDLSTDGVLDRSETAEENDRRWRDSGSAASPLIDWNQDGFIDFIEFSATGRAAFNELDADGNGSLDGREFTVPAAGGAPQGSDRSRLGP